jgi:hypothetical protein
MCVPALTLLMDCYSALGVDGMQEPGACFAERLELINCQKKEVLSPAPSGLCLLFNIFKTLT